MGVVTDKCICGKVKFKTEETANAFIKRNPKFNLKRTYFCMHSETWHVTHKGKIRSAKPLNYKVRLSQLEKELKSDMAKKTAKQAIIDYMQSKYDKDGTYKFSSKMILDYCGRVLPAIGRGSISAELSHMKKAKILINLDEKVPNQPGASYFALSSVLDKVTAPAETKEEMTTPGNIPTPTAPNPFDKVTAQLNEILTGLKAVNASVQTANSLHSNEALNDLIKVVLDEVRSKSPVADVNIAVLVEELTNLKNPKSLVYQLRDDLTEVLIRQESREKAEDTGAFQKRLDEIEELWRNVYNKAEGSEDYKRGIKDGIRIALEMNLTLPSE